MKERIFFQLVETRRVADMVVLVLGKFGFVSDTSHSRKTAPADGVVSPIPVDTVSKKACPIHETPRFEFELGSLYMLLVRTSWNLVKFGHAFRFSRDARMRSLLGTTFPVCLRCYDEPEY